MKRLFCKYKIMKTLDKHFESEPFLTVEQIADEIGYASHTKKEIALLNACLKELYKREFICKDENFRISAFDFSSYYEFKANCRNLFLAYLVSVSTLVSAVFSVLSYLK